MVNKTRVYTKEVDLTHLVPESTIEDERHADIGVIIRVIKACERNMPCELTLSFEADKRLENILMKEPLLNKKGSKILFLRLR